MAAKLNKRRALALYEQAQLHAQKSEWEKTAELSRQVAYASQLDDPAAFGLLADALGQLGRTAEVMAVLEDGLARFPKTSELEARLGAALLGHDDVGRALELLAGARSKLKRDPSFLTNYALALLKAGRTADAEQQLAAALLSGGGLETRLVLAMAKGRRGEFEAAQKLALAVETQATDERLRWMARAMRADCRLMLGDAKEGLAQWNAIRAAGRLEPAQVGHMAYAAQLAGEAELADQLIAERSKQGPTSEDLLLFAQIANVREQPLEALARLEAAANAPGEQFPGWDFECLATRGRALRLAGRREEAGAILQQALALPESGTRRFGPSVLVDLGHLAAEEGDFDGADQLYQRALALDPGDPEALRARTLTAKKVAWRSEVKASADARVEAAQAEADALRRRFLSREGELETLRQELSRLRSLQASTEDQARKAREAADRGEELVRAERAARLREELETREREADEKANTILNDALGSARAACPDALWQMLLVAERTYQRALYTELPAAAVAVLFSGALERSLFVLLVAPFDAWLDAPGRRDAFLARATREKRGRRVEYFDHFIEAFDRDLNAKAPALGEIGRVLERREEPYLSPFLEFLGAAFQVPAAFYDELAAFIRWSKERLRDPVAHGRAIELGYEELKRFREQLLFRFGAREAGALTVLLSAQTSPRLGER